MALHKQHHKKQIKLVSVAVDTNLLAVCDPKHSLVFQPPAPAAPPGKREVRRDPMGSSCTTMQSDIGF